MAGTTVKAMKKNAVYEIRHKRKGLFRAKFIETVATDDGDEMDEVFIRVEIDTKAGSGYEHLANAVEIDKKTGAKTTPRITEKLIRPSLVTAIDEVKGG